MKKADGTMSILDIVEMNTIMQLYRESIKKAFESMKSEEEREKYVVDLLYHSAEFLKFFK